MPEVVKWRQAVYGEEEYGFMKLPTGKYIVEGLREIAVESPVSDLSRLADYNICPIGTIEVELACLKDVETKPRKNGRCPDGYVKGERILGINFEDTQTKKRKVIGIDEPEPMKLDVFEAIEGENIRVTPVKEEVCVKIHNMPINKENVEVVINSIVGTGAYQEFPYWYVDFDYFDHLADVAYHKGLDIVGDVYRACYEEYKWKQCAYFKDKKTAEKYKKLMNYIEGENIEFELQSLWNEMKNEETYLGYNYNDYGGEPCHELEDVDGKKVLMCEIENDDRGIKLGWIKDI